MYDLLSSVKFAICKTSLVYKKKYIVYENVK